MIIYRPHPKLGEEREVIKFAYFPTRIGDSIVWLQKYSVLYQFKKTYRFTAGSFNPYPTEIIKWVEVSKSFI